MSNKPINENVQVNGHQLSGWPFLGLATGFVILLAIGVFWGTATSMVNIWMVSETFAHGFLIVPISLWLVWRSRHLIAVTEARPAPIGIVLLVILGLGWLVAKLVGVNVIQQLALVSMIAVIVYTLLGWQVTKVLSFPLAFLFFAVPIGKGLIPPLMDFTADFTVTMIELTGIPVYREGTFFELPTGNWSVVEGCSGVRYLIASVSLGTLYAYITYRSLKKRLIFIAVSIVAPIIANGLRAYMIVMIAHFSDMKLALGVDHFIYGWVFFGLVILLMFYVGSFWRDEIPLHRDASKMNHSLTGKEKTHYFRVSLLVVAAMAIWPLLAAKAMAPMDGNKSFSISLPESSTWQKLDQSLTEWRPIYVGADTEIEQTYEKDDVRVSLQLAYYSGRNKDAELINARNILVKEKHPVWQEKKRSTIEMPLLDTFQTVNTSLLRSDKQSLYVVHWYWLGGEMTASSLIGKLLEVKNALFGGDRGTAGVIVAVEMDESVEQVKPEIERFIVEMLPIIDASLRKVNKE